MSNPRGNTSGQKRVAINDSMSDYKRRRKKSLNLDEAVKDKCRQLTLRACGGRAINSVPAVREQSERLEKPVWGKRGKWEVRYSPIMKKNRCNKQNEKQDRVANRHEKYRKKKNPKHPTPRRNRSCRKQMVGDPQPKTRKGGKGGPVIQ